MLCAFDLLELDGNDLRRCSPCGRGANIAGIGGTCDRYSCNQEIGLALGKLAALVEQIISRRPAEVSESAAVAGAQS